MKYSFLGITHQQCSRLFCYQRRNIHIFFLLALFFPALASALALPSSQQTITPYSAVTTPKIGRLAADSRPIAVAAAATESGNFHLQVRTGALDAPMDAYLAILAQPIVPDTLLMLTADGSLQPMTSPLKPWKTNISTIDESPLDGIALSNLPIGDYTFFLLLVPAGSNNPLQDNYYLWSSKMVLTSAKELPPSESELLLDKSSILMGDMISISHPSILMDKPVTVTYDDGSDFSLSTTIVPTTNGHVLVNTPVLITDKPKYLRSGAVNVTLEGVSETASIFIVALEQPNSVPGEITNMVLQFSLEKLQATLDLISTLSSEEQATMEDAISSIQTQKTTVLKQIAQITNQHVSIEFEEGTETIGKDELVMIDRLMLMYIVNISEQYTSTEERSIRNIIPRNSGQADLTWIQRNVKEGFIISDALNAIKNVGIAGTQAFTNAITASLGFVSIYAGPTPIGRAASGTAAFIVLIQTTGLFTTTLVLDPSIDAVKGRAADLAKATEDGLIAIWDGFATISLGALGEAKWAGSKLASLLSLLRDTRSGVTGANEVICNTQTTLKSTTAYCTFSHSLRILGTDVCTNAFIPADATATGRQSFWGYWGTFNVKGSFVCAFSTSGYQLRGGTIASFTCEDSSFQKCTENATWPTEEVSLDGGGTQVKWDLDGQYPRWLDIFPN